MMFAVIAGSCRDWASEMGLLWRVLMAGWCRQVPALIVT